MDASTPVADGGDADAPPEDCLAPCVWELVRHCPPPAACTVQDYGTFHADGVSPTVTHSLRLACGENDWWDSGGDWYFNNRQDSIYVDGRLCYAMAVGRGGSGGGATPIRWGDGAQTVAIMMSTTASDLDGQAFCGTGGKPLTIFTCVNEQDCLSKGILMYNVQGTAPKCAPWRRIIDAAYGQFHCEKGCCPTDPPEVPEL